MSLDERFKNAYVNIQNLAKYPTNDEVLQLYSLGKQAIEGDNTRKKPSIFDIKETAKWKAWNNLKGVSRESAKEQYILLCDKLFRTYGTSATMPDTKLDKAKKKCNNVVLIGTISVAIVLTICLIVYRFTRDVRLSRKGTSVHKDRHKEWYGSKFPEQNFIPANRIKDEYENRVIVGRNEMKNKRCVIVGLARDINERVPNTVEKLKQMGECFKDWAALIFENDSTDGTRESLLEVGSKEPRIGLVGCPEEISCRLSQITATGHGGTSKKRMEKMADFRNRCLDEVRKKYPDYDVLIVVDMDLGGPISMDGMATCFSYTGWDAMTANGLVSRPLGRGDLWYYDTIAHVKVGEDPIALSPSTILKVAKPIFSSTYGRGVPPIQVRSAFGGCAIYNLKPLLESGAKYSGEYCEHVCLHLDMEKKGLDKIFINPSFMILHVMDLPI